MLKCAELGCFIGQGGKASHFVKIKILETKEQGFMCDTCDFVFWVDNIEKIPKITHSEQQVTQSHYPDFWHLLFNGTGMETLANLKSNLMIYKPIIVDEEYIAYQNHNQTERLVNSIKNLNRSIISIENDFHIFKDRRLQLINIEQAYPPAILLNKWITQPPRNPNGLPITQRRSQMIFPSHYPNVISREVWDYIKSVNPDIQILNQENEPIARPDE